MPGVTALVGAGTVAVAAAISGGLSVYAVRRHEMPGTRYFALFACSVAVWAGAYAAGLLTYDPLWRPVWEQVAWFGRATVGVWFLLFALAYTGYDGVVTRWRVAGLLALPAVTLGLVWTTPWHDLFWVGEPTLRTEFGMALVPTTVGPAFWASVAYTHLLVAAGALLVARLIPWSDYLYADQSALLLVGILTPFVGSLFTVLPPHPILGFDYTPYAFTVTGMAFGYALFRRRLFELVPGTRLLGSNPAIGQFDDGVAVLDADRRIVYCNDAAADVLDVPPEEAIGTEGSALVDQDRIDFEAEDALAEMRRDGRVYEVRASAITDRSDRRVGTTLVFHDVTARERRERALQRQRDELASLERLNETIRGVNRALVSAESREEIQRAVCERLADSDLYSTACIADLPTWTGEADRWVLAGDADRSDPPRIPEERIRGDDGGRESGRATESDREATNDPGDDDVTVRTPGGTPEARTDGGVWTVVPVAYGRTVYGALGLHGDHDVGGRERAVLSELGEIVGHAINATETRQLLAGEAVVELELERASEADPLVAAATAADCRFELAGVVPGDGDDRATAYLRVEDGDPSDACERLRAAVGDGASVRTEGSGGPIEWRPGEDGLLGTLVDRGGNLVRVSADDRRAVYELEVATDATARSLLDDVEERFRDLTLVAKRKRDGPVESAGGPPALAELTDRQREAIEAAYRAGYFEWPRDSTAEDVADSLGITAPTLHSHLRKAEKSILSDIFGGEGNDRSGAENA